MGDTFPQPRCGTSSGRLSVLFLGKQIRIGRFVDVILDGAIRSLITNPLADRRELAHSEFFTDLPF